MGRILLIRHGETTHNREGRLQGSRIDAELTDVGHLQAVHLALALAGDHLDALYSSPMRRARQTAATMATHHHVEHLAVQVVPELYEIDYGFLAGRPVEEVRGELEQTFDAWQMGFVDQAFPGGESALVAQQRVRPFAGRALAAARDGAEVALVAHGRINRVLAATLSGHGLPRMDEFPQSNASVTEFRVQGESVQVVRRNDTTHLQMTTDSAS